MEMSKMHSLFVKIFLGCLFTLVILFIFKDIKILLVVKQLKILENKDVLKIGMSLIIWMLVAGKTSLRLLLNEEKIRLTFSNRYIPSKNRGVL